MAVLEILRKRNRTLLEMHIGMIFYGLVCQIAGAFLVKDQAYYALSLWFGILMAAVSAVHMHNSLDRALCSVKDATKMAMRDFLIRYACIVVILLIIIKTEVMNPLIVFLAYMSLKGSALIQPFTHKLCNKIFRETDPVPQAVPEELTEPEEEP